MITPLLLATLATPQLSIEQARDLAEERVCIYVNGLFKAVVSDDESARSRLLQRAEAWTKLLAVNLGPWSNPDCEPSMNSEAGGLAYALQEASSDMTDFTRARSASPGIRPDAAPDLPQSLKGRRAYLDRLKQALISLGVATQKQANERLSDERRRKAKPRAFKSWCLARAMMRYQRLRLARDARITKAGGVSDLRLRRDAAENLVEAEDATQRFRLEYRAHGGKKRAKDCPDFDEDYLAEIPSGFFR